MAEEEQVQQMLGGSVAILERAPTILPPSFLQRACSPISNLRCQEENTEESRLWLGIIRNYKEAQQSGKHRPDAEALPAFSEKHKEAAELQTGQQRFVAVFLHTPLKFKDCVCF